MQFSGHKEMLLALEMAKKAKALAEKMAKEAAA